MKKVKKKSSLTKYLPMVLFAAVGAACGFFAASYIDTITANTGQFILWFVLLLMGLYLAVFLQLILHEAGHLVFGLLSGYHFSSFRIMSFMWVKEDGVLRFRRLSIAGTGGQCLMAPPELTDGKFPVLLYNLGGVLANLLLSGIAWGLSCAATGVPLLLIWLRVLSITGIALALMNGIPMHMGTVDNDGYNAFSLGKNPQAMRAFWVQLKVNQQVAAGIRLKDMPAEWFALPEPDAMGNSMVATLAVFTCNRMVDAHQFAEADALMARLLEMDSGIVGLHRSLMICDRVYIELITQNRQEVLAQMLTKEQRKFMASMKTFPSVLRTEYVYALLGEKNPGKAEKVKASFEKCAKTYPYSNDIQSERELMALAERSSRGFDLPDTCQGSASE